MKYKFQSWMLVAVGLLASQFSFAKGTDTDGDGRFSKAEITQNRQVQLDKKFSKADTNQDGQISMDELHGKRKGISKKADLNKDGVITKDEAQAHLSENVGKYLQKKDANGDGYVDQDERKRKPKSVESKSKKASKKQNNK